MAGKADLFRSVKDMFKPDVRQEYFAMVHRETGEKRPRTLEDHYAEVADAKLNPSVPDGILIQYDTARNVHLYAWCAYRLYQVAERQAYATLEMALRMRLGYRENSPPKPQPQQKKGKKGKKQKQHQNPPTLRPLLNEALAKSLIRKEGFEHYHNLCREDPTRKSELEKDFVQVMIECMAFFRNNLAHGTEMVHPTGGFVIRMCCDIINQLYPIASSPAPVAPATP